MTIIATSVEIRTRDDLPEGFPSWDAALFEAFKTVTDIRGYLFVDDRDDMLTSMSFLRNLRVVRGNRGLRTANPQTPGFAIELRAGANTAFLGFNNLGLVRRCPPGVNGVAA